ncbi:hypothetical protein NJF54_22930 [Pseudomonas guariconensis]|uniref:hypothetical protein n=1 Tax=Pseudomonas TaxID=286 RepID=UPI001CE489C0|nr:MULTISPECIES: hypothetical protein [Pseudomonas]MCO7634678.1 hypothetical protein [Pseudomonas guariconensis]
MPSQPDLHYSCQPLIFELLPFPLDEGLSAPFQLSLERISEEDGFVFGQLLEQPVLFMLWRPNPMLRHILLAITFGRHFYLKPLFATWVTSQGQQLAAHQRALKDTPSHV